MARRPTAIPDAELPLLRELLREARTKGDAQRIECVLLRATAGMPAEEIASALGLGVSTVRRLHAGYLREGVAYLRSLPRGGRRRENLTLAEETALLDGLAAEAGAGRFVTAATVRAEYSRRVGRPVHHSVVYRLLARGDWRKVAPRPRHPERDLAAQAEYQKKRSRGPCGASRGEPPATDARRG